MAGSTHLSLNDRFTRLATVRDRSRSRSRSRANYNNAGVGAGRAEIIRPEISLADISRAEMSRSIDRRPPTEANVRFLRQLVHKHQMRTAMKLKRKSIRTATTSINRPNRAREPIKAIRVAANGRPVKLNSLGGHATMRADLETQNNRRRRGLLRAPFAARRRAESILQAASGVVELGRARSRSRTRTRIGQQAAGSARFNDIRRARSRSRSRNAAFAVVGRSAGPARSRSRGRLGAANNAARIGNFANNPRGRSRSRTRNGFNANANKTPITDRLGVRPGSNVANGGGNRRRRDRSTVRQGQVGNQNRGISARLGVQQGRVEKRRGSGANQMRNGGRNGARVSRSRVRLNNQNITNGGGGGGNRRGRSQSRGRRAGTGQQQTDNGNGIKGRRNNGRRNRNTGNGNIKGTNRNQSQPRRGRSRSRNRAAGNGRGGRGSNQGKSRQQPLKREDLDQELDQYMSTTKTD